MNTIFYQDYRIEIRPTPIPGGWSAQVHIWYFESGTTRMTPLALPVHIPFGTAASVCAYAEKVARQWVEKVSGEGRHPASVASRTPEEGEGPGAATPSYSLSAPTRLKRSGSRRRQAH